ncbi:urocortin 3, like [Lampris incognitus]|uniref:urocortin 3, like n=1 Tax=Lampris incognitus TaxID=2546036 RepID=UPI0024B51749|nr:urocortin 3, like [Lampris incognitus]
MLSILRTLLLLHVLCAPTSSLCLRLYQTEPEILCDERTPAAIRSADEPNYSAAESWSSREYPSASSASSSDAAESRERRASNRAAANYRFLSQTKFRSKTLQNSAKSDRRSKFTLSLDVPTNIMNVLFDIAKAKNLRDKAADNARLLAQIGRRK